MDKLRYAQLYGLLRGSVKIVNRADSTVPFLHGCLLRGARMGRIPGVV